MKLFIGSILVGLSLFVAAEEAAAKDAAANVVEVDGKENDQQFVSEVDDSLKKALRKRRSIAHGGHLSGALLGHPAWSSYRVGVPGSLYNHAGHVGHIGRVDYLGAAGLAAGVHTVGVEGGHADLGHGYGYRYGYGRLGGYYGAAGLAHLRPAGVVGYGAEVVRPGLGYAYGYGYDHGLHRQGLGHVHSSPVTLAGLTRGDYYEAAPIVDDGFTFANFYSSFTPLRAVKTHDNVYVRNYIRHGSFDDCLKDFHGLRLHEVKTITDSSVLGNELTHLSGAGVAVSDGHYATAVEAGVPFGYVGVMRDYPYQVYALREGCHVDGYSGYHDCIVFRGATYPYANTIRRFVYINQPQVLASHTVDRVISDRYAAGGWGDYVHADK